MSLYLQQQGKGYRWAVWKMDESVEELLDLLPSKEEYRRGAEHFKAVSRRQEWLSVRVLLYRMLGEEKEIVYQPEGKPYLADGSYCISISHTKGYVAVILGADREVGIDIEQYGKRVHQVASRFMRDDEQAGVYQGDATWGELLHWSAKETLYKCVEGSDADFRQYRIYPFEVQEQGELVGQGVSLPGQPRWTVSYLLTTDFVLTWLT